MDYVPYWRTYSKSLRLLHFRCLQRPLPLLPFACGAGDGHAAPGPGDRDDLGVQFEGEARGKGSRKGVDASSQRHALFVRGIGIRLTRGAASEPAQRPVRQAIAFCRLLHRGDESDIAAMDEKRAIVGRLPAK